MRKHLQVLWAALLAAGSVGSAVSQAPLSLFNGTSLLGWTSHGNWSSGGMLSTSGGGSRRLFTAVPFGDFSLEFEYSESANLNAQVRLWASHDENGGLVVDLDSSNAKAGMGGIEVLGRSPISSSSGGTGWHKVQIEASHGAVTVRVDGQSGGSANDLGSRAGYLGFDVNGDGQFSVRNVHLRPLNLNTTFNGSDLGGWKSIARPAESKGGITHSAEKMVTFGLGGGSTKAHEAKWTVKGGAIHGESGPGALENSTPLEDGIVQITATVRGDVKQDNFTELSMRNTAGQFAVGYPIGIGPYAGMVDRLNKYNFGKGGAAVDETIAIGGRVIETWINGNIASVVTDPRPESANPQTGSKTAGGTVMLVLPNDHPAVDVSRLNLIALGKPYGASPRAPAPPPVPTTAAVAAPALPPVNAGDSAAAQALEKQQQAQAKKDAEDQRNRDTTASLMTQALAATDPQSQKDLYSQVMRIDPSNPNAMQGYKEAQAKLQQMQAADANAASKQQDAHSKDEQTNTSLVAAQGAFLGGHLSEASNALSVAERLSPGNPLVRELRSRISGAQAQRTRLFMLAGGAGLVALMAGILAWVRRRKTQQFPMLEVTSGIDAGRTYRIEKDQTRIGAVPQDGGQRNDIVVRDVEHAISRFHCEIVKRNGQLYLQDLNSSNGTKVNGETVKAGDAALLRKGTRIQLAGTVELRFGYDSVKKTA